MSITSKNIPDIFEKEQRPILNYISNRLVEIEKQHKKLQFAVLDAIQFEESTLWGEYRLRPELEIYNEHDCVVFVWNNSNGKLVIKFFGYGQWCYELNTLTAHFQFEGTGHKWTDEDLYNQKDSPYFFYLEKCTEEVLSQKDEFMNNYSPMVEYDSRRNNFTNYVSMEWCTNKYDGPLSGYCKLNRKLYYFDMIEETNISRERMYAIYNLNTFERVIAHINRKRWSLITNNKFLWILYMWHYKVKQDLQLLFHTDYNKRRKKWRDNHKVVGYFKC